MKLPVFRGLIERRILVNYRASAEVVARTLPSPFQPKLYRGLAMVGICLIRLSGFRPSFMPSWLGISSENAAHRTAVQWIEEGEVREGVYIHRRDTSSRINALTGGRLFPGIHSHARFSVHESDRLFVIRLQSDDRVTNISVAAEVVDKLPGNSLFSSLAAASEFFRAGAVGYSATPDPKRFQGLEMRCENWQVTPLKVFEVQSSYFDDTNIFPAGSIEFDNALLMRNIEHQWHGQADLCCTAQFLPKVA